MKISLNKIKLIPAKFGFGFCVYGDIPEEISNWVKFWNFELQIEKNYTNIIIGDINIFNIFDTPKQFKFGDLFSPNLNKHLHLGHLSNLIIGKSLYTLGIVENTVAILGDTLEGAVDKSDALQKYNNYCNNFGYTVDNLYFASEQKVIGNYLVDGEGDYLNTKIFDLGEDNKIVGIKSDGSTSYFYQDVALAEMLNASTLYLTGVEQIPHFQNLKILFPHIEHIGLGLVLVDGKKMSSSEGNVFFMEDILNMLKEKFNGDEKLVWNVLCGFILKYNLPTSKNIILEDIDNVKKSQGLYLSYTLARLKSAGMVPNYNGYFNSQLLQYNLLQARTLIKPNVLFDGLVGLCNEINKLYINNRIKDNEESVTLFQPMMDDLIYGLLLLGMYEIEKV